jgi:Sulfate permease family
MLAGTGVLILASQFHIMVDDVPRGSGIQNLVSIPKSIRNAMFPPGDTSHHMAAMMGISTILTLLAFPGLLSLIPIAVLAAILVYTGAKLVNPRQVTRIGKVRARRSLHLLRGTGRNRRTRFVEGRHYRDSDANRKLGYTFTHLRIQSQCWQDGKGIDFYMEGRRRL